MNFKPRYENNDISLQYLAEEIKDKYNPVQFVIIGLYEDKVLGYKTVVGTNLKTEEGLKNFILEAAKFDGLKTIR